MEIGNLFFKSWFKTNQSCLGCLFSFKKISNKKNPKSLGNSWQFLPIHALSCQILPVLANSWQLLTILTNFWQSLKSLVILDWLIWLDIFLMCYRHHFSNRIYRQMQRRDHFSNNLVDESYAHARSMLNQKQVILLWWFKQITVYCIRLFTILPNLLKAADASYTQRDHK